MNIDTDIRSGLVTIAGVALGNDEVFQRLPSMSQLLVEYRVSCEIAMALESIAEKHIKDVHDEIEFYGGCLRADFSHIQTPADLGDY